MINNRDYFKVNSELHNINARTESNLHQQISNLSAYQKGIYYSGIKVFSSLPSQIKDLTHNRNQFKRALKISCTFIHFIFWMNISVAVRNKILTIV